MTKLFLDTNIVVDLLERREPFCHDAVRVNIRLSMQKAMGSRYVFMPCRLLKRPFLQRKYN